MMKHSRLIMLVCLLLCMAASAAAQDPAGERNPTMNNQALIHASPRSYDPQAAQKLGLHDGTGYTDEYFLLQQKYALGLMDFLDEILSLKALDAALAEDSMRFIPCPEGERDMYQKSFSFGMRYLYLRNNVCIERLTEDRLAVLRDEPQDSPLFRDLVAATWKAVTAGVAGLSENSGILYDMSTGHRAPNGALVLGLRAVPEYDPDGNYVDPAHETEKSEYLRLMGPALEQRLSALLDYPVRVFLKR